MLACVPSAHGPVPEGDVIITYSELDTFRQCPLKHKWNYQMLFSREPVPGTPLSRGNLWHSCLETYYYEMRANKLKPLDAKNAVVDLHLDNGKGQFVNEDAALIDWMLNGHVECYGNDPDWEVLAIEFAGRVKLGVLPDGRTVWLQFKLDLIVREISTGRIWIVDHKSAKDFTRQVEIDIDDQFGLYMWALTTAGVPVFGFIRSDARTQRNKGAMTLEQRFKRTPTFRTAVEMENIANDAMAATRAVYSGSLFSSPAPDHCTWRCEYLQVHLMARKTNRDHAELLDSFGFTVREKRHREYGDNYPRL
jgi:hypothetical protein